MCIKPIDLENHPKTSFIASEQNCTVIGHMKGVFAAPSDIIAHFNGNNGMDLRVDTVVPYTPNVPGQQTQQQMVAYVAQVCTPKKHPLYVTFHVLQDCVRVVLRKVLPHVEASTSYALASGMV